MEFVMDCGEAVGVDVGVDFGGADVGMAQHFLNDAQVGAVGEQVAGEGVAQRVRVDILMDAGAGGGDFHHIPDPFPVQRTAAFGEKHIGGTRIFLRQQRSHVGQIAPQRAQRDFADRHDPGFAAFADHPQQFVVEIHGGQRQPGQLADPQPGGVQHLQNGAVAHLERLLHRGGEGLQKGVHLRFRQEVRQDAPQFRRIHHGGHILFQDALFRQEAAQHFDRDQPPGQCGGFPPQIAFGVEIIEDRFAVDLAPLFETALRQPVAKFLQVTAVSRGGIGTESPLGYEVIDKKIQIPVEHIARVALWLYSIQRKNMNSQNNPYCREMQIFPGGGMMKVLMILAGGFEETEAIAVADVLRRLNIDVTVAGLDSLEPAGAHGFTVKADALLEKCGGEPCDGVFLPGGMPGATNLLHSEAVLELVRRIDREGGVISAICAAPIVLARAGLLAGRRFTMYPGFEQYLGGMTPTGELAECDGRVVTGKGPGAVFAFAAKLAAALGKSRQEIAAAYAAMFIEL